MNGMALLPVVLLVSGLTLAVPAYSQPLSAELLALSKSLGTVTQASAVWGNGVIVDRCHVLTSFHVAFGKLVDPVTKQIEIFDSPAVGHQVDFSYDFDTPSGRLTKRSKATVTYFGDYSPGVGRGMVADTAMLRLDPCVDGDFVKVAFDLPDTGQRVPMGNLVTLSFMRARDGKYEMLSFAKCPSDPVTVVTGLFLANCGMPPGSSGSMLLSSERADGKWRMVGLSTNLKTFPDGSQATFAIYSRALLKFIEDALGPAAAASLPK